jgi:hypothetical protein
LSRARDGDPTAVARERTAVESASPYRSTVRVDGTFRRDPRAIADVSAYANGSVRIVRVNGRTDSAGTIEFTEPLAGGPATTRVDGPVDGTDPFAARTAAYLRRTLVVMNATIVDSFERDGTRYVWFDLSRQPMPGTAMGGSVLADERGLVHAIRYEQVQTTMGSPSMRTVVTLRITPENVTATPPPWAQSAP